MKILTFICLLLSISLFGTEFKYNFNESYRIESTVYQDVKYNRELQVSSIILNKYSVNVDKILQDRAILNISHQVFQESEGLLSGFYTTETTEEGNVLLFDNGLIEPISNKMFPAVQNIPYFPDRDIQIGESWTGMAKEYFNLNNGFKVNDYIITTFRVFYRYIENKVIDGDEMALITMDYNIYEKVNPKPSWGDFYPVKISGGSKQLLVWDLTKGRPHSLKDEYFLDFTISNGDLYTFKGRTDSKSWPKNELKSEKMIILKEILQESPQTKVTEDSKSLKITFNSLLFEPESYRLNKDAIHNLDNVGSALKEIKGVNIKITGHTAIFRESDPNYLKELSMNRAKSVAEYLIKMSFIDQNSIEILGMGGNIPVGSNETSIGRSLNRRVEIDILKN